MKKRYKVFTQYYLDAEDPEDCIEGDWNFAGETFAASEAQAINNVKFRMMGAKSQYKPLATGGRWENGLNWKAIEC
jgi:hypothetical protein